MAKKKSGGSKPPAQASPWISVGVVAFLVAAAAWLCRGAARIGCREYFAAVANYRHHPLEGGLEPWWEGSSLTSRVYAGVCLPEGLWRRPARPTLLVDDPKVYVLDDFLSAAECEGVLTLHRKQGSKFHGSTMQGSEDDDFRTSLTASFDVEQEIAEPLLTRIVQRMHLSARMPPMHGEMLQIARYRAPGGKYELHRDADNGVRRLVTALVYLTDDGVAGGETIFPMVKPNAVPDKPRPVAVDMEALARGEGFEVKRRPLAELCAERQGALVAPKRGRLVLIYNLGEPWEKANGDVNITLNAYHGSCEVTAGEKWILQRWMHVEPNPDQLDARGI